MGRVVRRVKFACSYVNDNGRECDLKPIKFFYDEEFSSVISFCAAHDPLNHDHSRTNVPPWEIAFRLYKGKLRPVSRKEAIINEIMDE